MKRIVYVVIFLTLLLLDLPNQARSELTQIRIGWQIPWATQGQIVQILKRTDIFERNGLKGKFFGRIYGPMLNELAIAGEVDVILTADQPAASLFSKNAGWIGIGRLMYNRTLTYVPPKSPINTMSDLRGKVIGIPIGAATERITIEGLNREGLDVNKDVKIINVGIMEQGPIIIGSRDGKTWQGFDALSGFDPTPAIFQSKGLVRVIDVGKVCSMVLMNKKIIANHQDTPCKFMQAVLDAYDFYRQNLSVVNNWFMEEAQLKDATDDACNIAASIEPNVWVSSRDKIRVFFNEDDFIIMQRGADFIEKKTGAKVNMKHFVTNEYAITVK
jgi:ABC-type nitrate/sulfonate/bicarbonate transport system substrate-binding protein